MTKQEKEAVAQEICNALPSAPRERVRMAFMGSLYDSIDAVYRSETVLNETTGKKERAVKVRCGFCGAETWYPYVRIERPEGCCHAMMGNFPADRYGYDVEGELKYTGERWTCPNCGERSRAVAYCRTNNRTIGYEKNYVAELHNIKGHLIQVEWKLEKWLNREGEEQYRDQRENAEWQVDGRMFRASGYEFYGYMCMNSVPSDHWRMLVRYQSGARMYKREGMDFDEADIAACEEWNDGLRAFLTSGGKSRWINFVGHLQIWSKHPNFENVEKWAPVERIDEIVSPRAYGEATPLKKANRYFDWKKVRPHEMMGVEKEKALSFFKEDLSFPAIAIYRDAKRNGTVLSISELKKLGYSAESFLNFRETQIWKQVSPPMVKGLRYYAKHANQQRTMEDYWRMTIQVEGEVTPDRMFPKDIRLAHDQIMERIRAKADESKNKGIRKVEKRLQKFNFTDFETGLCIRPAHSAAELIREGKELHHCVGSYVDRVARGETAILFIRRIDDPETPFYTLEWCKERIVQDHGNGNRLQTPEVLEFEKKWIKNMKKVRKKESGKRNHSERAAAVGA